MKSNHSKASRLLVLYHLFLVVATSTGALIANNAHATQEIIASKSLVDIEKDSTRNTHVVRGGGSSLIPLLDASATSNTRTKYHSSNTSSRDLTSSATTAVPSSSHAPTPTPTQDYVVKIKTGGNMFASTNSNIYLSLFGDKGSTEEIHLNGIIDSDVTQPFERGNTDTVILDNLADIGTPQKVTVRHDGTAFGSDWYLEWILVNDVKFTFDQWVDNESVTAEFPPITKTPTLAPTTTPPTYVPTPTPFIDYVIEIKTGDRFLAGTSSNIYMILFGDKRNTEEIHLNEFFDTRDDTARPFDRGNTDKLVLEDHADLGTLQNITIRSDAGFFGSDWYLEWVTVNLRKFTFDQWIKDESVTITFSTSTLMKPTPSPSRSNTSSHDETKSPTVDATNSSSGKGTLRVTIVIMAIVILLFIHCYCYQLSCYRKCLRDANC